jgi:hypothetical protein
LLQIRATVLLLPSQGVPFTWKSGTFIPVLRETKIVIFRPARAGSACLRNLLHFYGNFDNILYCI